MKNKLYYIYLVILTALVAGCQDEAMFTAEDDGLVTVSYRVKVGDDLQSRAIGDGMQVNELIVGVFQNNTQIKQYTSEVENGTASINIPLLKTETYDLVFWAQKKDNRIYNTNDLSNITIDYSQYDGISLVDTEAFEAFSTVRRVENLTDNEGTDITLTRPFAQINVAASEEELVADGNSVDFIISKVYTKYNLLTGEVVEEAENQNFSFAISEDDITDKQQISISGTNYYYLASAYLFAPAKVILTGGIYKGQDLEKELNFPELPLAANTRTNIYGDMIQQEVMEAWDGSIEKPIIQDNKYIIDAPSKLAWLASNENTLTEPATFLVTEDLDMNDLNLASLRLPIGSTIMGQEYENEKYPIISNLNLTNGALFGVATNLKVQNLIIDDVTVNISEATEDTHVGVLVNTLKGTSTFTNVTVSNSSATTNKGAAGGIVGYIVRSIEDNRGEELNVTFDNCHVIETSVEGTRSTGHFVGLLRGYDNGEILTFKDNCTLTLQQASTVAEDDFVSPYSEGNESVWLASTDYSSYDGWLGDEECYRGTVIYGTNRFIPKWDGKAMVEPLSSDSELDGISSGKVIYSPADLAWFQGKNYTSTNVYLRSDLDMGGNENEQAPVFNPILTMKHLDGLRKNITEFTSFDDCYKIHNLKVVKVHANGNGAAFILTGSGGHTHQNLVFDSSSIISKHDETITNIDDPNYGNAYAGTIVCKVTGNYTVQNVLIQNGSVSGICKMGVLLGYCSGNLQATNCIVDQCTITNYDPQCINWYTQREDIESLNMVAYAKDSFFTDGEVGGLIGFITACSPTITNCSVINTTIDCTGEENKSVTIGVYNADGFNENNPGSPTIKGQVTIAGRHVNQFIGDIRTQNTTDVITINNPYVENNRYLRDGDEHLISETETKTKTEEWSEGSGLSKKNYRTYDCNNTKTYSTIVGCAYVVAVTLKVNLIFINIDKHVGDYKGVININNSNITEQSTRTTEVKKGTEGSWTKYNCTYNWTYETFKNPVGETAIDRFIGDDFSM